MQQRVTSNRPSQWIDRFNQNIGFRVQIDREKNPAPLRILLLMMNPTLPYWTSYSEADSHVLVGGFE